jgi:exodeoxyribonuclease-5
MTDITLTDTQADAVKRTQAWYLQCKRELADGKPLTQQIWRIFGFAGVGKSTITKYALAEMGDIKMVAGTFTGKAALVLTRKGTPTSTIHSLCYAVQEHSREAIDKAKEELAAMRAAGPGEMQELLWRAVIHSKEESIKDMHSPKFALNPDSVVRDADLVVIDEVSMVNEIMAADLMSFGRPILVLGDPGQLPPIKGEGAFTQAEPDIMLTEIHRQAKDSPIIRLATMAREGVPIPYGVYSDNVVKMRRSELSATEMLMADQVLTGMNSTRIGLNNAMRRASGHTSILPDGASEKIICLKNRNDVGLVNGSFLTLHNIDEDGEYGFRADIFTDDDQEIGRHTIYKGHFLDHVEMDKERLQRDHWHLRGLVQATYGYSCTVHKAQGSGWPNVILYDDGFGRGDDRKKWLYTALTRSEEGLCILA